MCKREIKPLVITPEVINGESIWGYLLRVSEMNGYESPTN